MKKYLVLLVSIIISILSVSCNKDEAFSLVGKTYAGFELSTSKFDSYRSWRFISETEVESTDRKNAPDGPLLVGSSPLIGSYTLDYPKLLVTINEPYFGEITYECEFINETCFRTSLIKDNITEFNLQ